MATVIMICGKLCSGKTAYAGKLRKERGAVTLSVDEIMLAMFGGDAGEAHDTYVIRLKKYLLDKSLELLEAGINVIFDWGLWTKAERREAKAFFAARGIPCEIHYLDLEDEEWRSRIDRRNRMVLEGKTSTYFVDEGLFQKADSLFEKPQREEIDVWVQAAGSPGKQG